ncbi:MAG: serine/threonine-protein kinase [Gemmatimonadaceae bacterium]
MGDLNIRIGPYRLLHVLGQGGMGVVYQAEQLEPVRREVAVKLIHASTDGLDVVVRRFESERQAHAVMDHPSIARMYDGGVSEDGRPYFVMELVRGVPLLQYCDANRFSLAARSRLFTQVCRAVQHAHQKGVIHRDLKPSNILVTETDGQPLAKVIDFGIARTVLPAESAERLTIVGQLIGTPAYMSPEQLSADTDVDTRSDVYALGVVLYELYTGVLPHDHEEYLSLARYGAAPEDPPTPGHRVSKLGVAAQDVAARRGADPSALVRALRGDLDWIVMKAMEANRERRYDTANALAADLERSLANEPVLARPPSRAYRARKFIRRHTLGVASGVVIALLLAGSAVSQAVQARRVAVARDEAVARRAQAEGLIDFMLGDLWEKLEGVGRLEILNDVGERAVGYFAQVDPALFSDEEVGARSRMLYNIGNVRMRQGNSTAATRAFEESLRLAKELAARKPGDAEALFNLGQSEFWVGSGYYRQMHYAKATAHFQAYRDVSRGLVARDSSNIDWAKELGYSHTNVGAVELAIGNSARAAEEFRAALEVKERVLATRPDDRSLLYDVARAHYNVGEALIPGGDLPGAEAALDRDIAIKRSLLAVDPRNAVWRNTLVNSLTSRGMVVGMRGNSDLALGAFAEAAAVLDELSTADATNRDWRRRRAFIAVLRAEVLVSRGDLASARALLAQGVQVLEELAAADAAFRVVRENLGYAQTVAWALELRAGRTEAARDFAVAAGRDSAPPGAYERLLEGRTLAQLGDANGARRKWEDVALLTARSLAAGDDPRVLATAVEAQLLLDRRAEAERLLSRLRKTGFREAGFVQRLRELGVQY